MNDEKFLLSVLVVLSNLVAVAIVVTVDAKALYIYIEWCLGYKNKII
jgi:hypothetical protein